MTTQKVTGKVADLGGEERGVGWMVTCVCVCVFRYNINKEIGFLFLSVLSKPSMCDSQTDRGIHKLGHLVWTPFVVTWGGALI
jgi:hypothetical protein